MHDGCQTHYKGQFGTKMGKAKNWGEIEEEKFWKCSQWASIHWKSITCFVGDVVYVDVGGFLPPLTGEVVECLGRQWSEEKGERVKMSEASTGQHVCHVRRRDLRSVIHSQYLQPLTVHHCTQ